MIGLLIQLPPHAANATTTEQWALISLGVLTILYVAVIRPMRKGKSRRDPLERSPRQATLAQQRAVERDMSNLLVEYEEMIRRMTAQLDTRATRLELLIREAEDKIAQLKALRGVDSAAGNGSGPAPAPANDAPALPAATAPQVAGGGELPAPVVNAASAGVAAAPGDAGPVDKGDDRHSEVYRLADGGRTAQQIAQDLNRPYGEVELILHLRNPSLRQGSLWEQPASKPAAESFPDQACSPPETPAAPEPEQRRRGRKKARS